MSTSRYNKTNAMSELWFTLLMCDDSYPIISRIQFPGLISAFTNENLKEVISKIKTIQAKNPDYFQFILKIVPIDFICETKIKTIEKIIEQNYKNYIDEKESFKITLKRRHHPGIERENFIEIIANLINNSVDLEAPDKIIRFEVLGNITGISFLKRNEIITIKK
ncbi:MAG: THUMP domain-containing protein [Candidatus Lokiarchaeia archaeon]|nr:THUMP domain-containing protein [Candidatus Lokiarchaeia archaeon]